MQLYWCKARLASARDVCAIGFSRFPIVEFEKFSRRPAILCKMPSMSAFTRYLLAWMLMLAIPVQGFAASAMLFCAPNHHNIVSAQLPMKVDDSSNASTSHAFTSQHPAHHHVATAQPQSQDDPSSSSSKPVDAKCSACSTCCIGSVIISAEIFAAHGLSNSVLIPFIQKTIISFSPDGFDPPPKSLLA